MTLDEQDLREGLKFIVGTWQVDYVVNAFSNDLAMHGGDDGADTKGTWEQTGWSQYRYTLNGFLNIPEGTFRDNAEKLEVSDGHLVFAIGFLAIALKKIAEGTVTEHKMFAKGDPGSGWGSNEGRIKAMPITISNCQTKGGRLIVYTSEAKFTEDPIEEAYFGCAGVAEIPNLQDKLVRLARGGFKHHTSIGCGHMKAILDEAFTTYLGYDLVEIDR